VESAARYEPDSPSPATPPRYMRAAAEALSISSLFAILLRRWKLFAAVVVILTAAIVALTFMLKPLYSATAQIQIESQPKTAADFGQSQQGGPPDQALIDTEVNLIQSLPVAQMVVRSLNLADDPDFAGSNLAAASANSRENIASNELLSRLDVGREGSTYLVSITADADDPASAALVANSVAEAYLAVRAETRAAATGRQTEEMRRLLESLGQEASSASAQAVEYRASRGIVEGGASGTITEQQIAPLADKLANAEAEAAAAAARLAAARRQMAEGRIEAVSGALNSNVIADLRRQRAEVQRRQSEISTRYGPSYPETQALQTQLADLDKQLRDEAQRIVGGYGAEAAATKASVDSLRSEMMRLRGAQASETRASVAAETLERDADTKRAAYDQLAKAVEQTIPGGNDLTPIGFVVQRAARPSRPSFPNRPLFAVLGLVFGVLAGACSVALVEAMDQRFRSVAEIERATGLRKLGLVPPVSKTQLRKAGVEDRLWDYIIARPMSRFAEVLRGIRTSLLAGHEGRSMVVAVCSSSPNEGKTTIAASLARTCAMSGDRVLIIDCDLRRGGLSELTGTTGEGGLVELLENEVALERTIVNDPQTGLYALPLAERFFSPRDILGSRAMAELLDRFRREFDFVILDTPPLLAVDDARRLAEMADRTVFILDIEKATASSARSAVERLHSGKVDVVGVVVIAKRANNAEAREAANAYPDYDGYYQD